MRVTRAPWTLRGDQDLSAVQGGAADGPAVERRVAPDVERAAPRQRAMAARQGRLRPAEPQHRWPVAAVSGDPTPEAFEPLRRRARWGPEAVREELRRALVPPLEAAEAVLGREATGVLTKGRHAAGGARPDRGTAGTVDHGPIGVGLASARRRGQALRDRERSRPQAWTDARDRCPQAGMPEARGVATTPHLARPRRARACTAGVPAPGGTGDRGDGHDRRRRRWLEGQPHASGLAVSGPAAGWRDWRPRRSHTRVASGPASGGSRLRAGEGAQGPRGDDWRGLAWAEPVHPAGRRGLLVRRRVRTPHERPADGGLAPHDTPLAAVVPVGAARWPLAQRCAAATGAGGGEQDEVRSWTGG
jgi:DDE superfamily endonuclease